MKDTCGMHEQRAIRPLCHALLLLRAIVYARHGSSTHILAISSMNSALSPATDFNKDLPSASTFAVSRRNCRACHSQKIGDAQAKAVSRQARG